MPEIDPIAPWFLAMEELGEYIGIRFGRVPPGTDQPEWIFLRHAEYDGIGGFAHILRQRGAELCRLPHMKYPSDPSWSWLLKMLPKYLTPRRRLKWGPLNKGPAFDTKSGPPPAVAWHVFDEDTTTDIRRACRKSGFTVNSFLLKHLTKAIRPSLQDEASDVPWMIPVNLRGKILRDRDTTNYSSYIGIKVRSYETVHDVHRTMYAGLASGEHWSNWYSYKSGRFLGPAAKKFLFAKELCMSQWCLGGFSNLGDWDPDKKITAPDCLGGWVFSPPVLRCQLVGAGCVTFQNRLSLVVQAHPELTTDPAVAQAWMQNWLKEIDIDLASLVSQPAAKSAASPIALPRLAA